jgi:hypothetical protein
MWACYLDHLDHLKLLCRLDESTSRVNIASFGGEVETDNDGKTWLHWSVRKSEPLHCLNVKQKTTHNGICLKKCLTTKISIA